MKTIQVVLDGDDRTIPAGRLRGTALRNALRIGPEFYLFFERLEGGESPIHDDDTYDLLGGARLRSVLRGKPVRPPKNDGGDCPAPSAEGNLARGANRPMAAECGAAEFAPRIGSPEPAMGGKPYPYPLPEPGSETVIRHEPEGAPPESAPDENISMAPDAVRSLLVMAADTQKTVNRIEAALPAILDEAKRARTMAENCEAQGHTNFEMLRGLSERVDALHGKVDGIEAQGRANAERLGGVQDAIEQVIAVNEAAARKRHEMLSMKVDNITEMLTGALQAVEGTPPERAEAGQAALMDASRALLRETAAIRTAVAGGTAKANESTGWANRVEAALDGLTDIAKRDAVAIRDLHDKVVRDEDPPSPYPMMPAPVPVTVYLDGRPMELGAGSYTGLELRHRFKVRPEQVLWSRAESSTLAEVHDNETVTVVADRRFYTTPA